MYIGFDIGGTNVRYALSSNLEAPIGRHFCNSFVKTGEPYTEIEENICKVIEQYSIDGIAISLAANIERRSGIIKTWSNNPSWNGYKFVNHLKNRFDVPIIVEDDANCGALGEFYGLPCLNNSMVYITIGTGIGCGLIINGEIYVGDNGMAGELGHITGVYEGEQSVCSCGQLGCLQSLISGRSLIKRYNSNSNHNIESVHEMTERSLRGDKVAQYLLGQFKSKLINVVYNLAMILDVSTFVIGGGVGTINADLFFEIEECVNGKLKRFEKIVRIYRSRFRDYSGVHGAFHLLKKYIKSIETVRSGYDYISEEGNIETNSSDKWS